MKYEHVTTVSGLRRTRSVVGDEPILEVILEDDLWDHVIGLDYNQWAGKIKLGDGVRIIVEEEQS